MPIPAGHRTDWGAEFIGALESRLQDLHPRKLDRARTGTSRGRGGALIVRLVHAETGEQIEIFLWEDEADVRYNGAHTRFKLPTRAAPGGWIPEAVQFVEQLLAGRVTVTKTGRRTRTTIVRDVDDASPPGSDSEWTGGSFL